MKKRRKFSFALMFTSAAVATCLASCENKSNNTFVPVNEVVSETTAVQNLETTSAEAEKTTTSVTTAIMEQTVETESTTVALTIVDIESIVNKVCETATVTTTETQVQVIQITSVVTQYVAQPQIVIQTQAQPVAVQTQPPAQPDNLVNSEVEAVNVAQEVAIQYQSGIATQSYYVQEGDCLWSIASNNGVDVTDIQAINPGVCWDFIQPGDCINLPSYSSTNASVYYVEAGDCLSLIADKNGYTMDEIIASNPGVDWDYIQPGEVISLPSYTWNSAEVTVAYNSDAPAEFIEEVSVQEPVFVDEISYVQESVIIQEPEIIVAEVDPETVENVTPEAIATEKVEENVETQNIEETTDSIDEIEEVVHVESIDVYAEENVVLEAADDDADESNAEVELDVEYTTRNQTLDITNYDDAMAIQDHIHKRGYNGGSMDITAGGRIGWMYAKTYSNEYNVLSNIDRAVETLDGYKVPAYGEFSWFDVVGSGYDYLAAETKIDFYDGEPEEAVPIEPGGGVNLPATVLRNAVENLVGSENIIEAYDQTDNGVPEDMRYANVGHEASINYPETDLKFINPYSEPIEITARFNWQNKSCMIDCYCKAAG